MTTARAAFFVPGEGFEIAATEVKPPEPGEVRVAISYCGVCGTDLHIYHGAMAHRLDGRRVLGHEASGIVAAVGDGVENVAIGDRVVIRPLASCGTCPACVAGHAHVCHRLKFLGIDTDGGFADYWTVPADTLHVLPAAVPMTTAALAEPLAVACHDVRRGRVQSGEAVLVMGGGPIGLLVALAARAAGGVVCVAEVNPHRLGVIAGLGFDVVNPAEDNLPEVINARTGGRGADVIFEVSGAQAALDATTAVAAVRGRIVMVAIYPDPPRIDMFQYFWKELELIGARVYEPRDYDAAIAMLAAGEVPADTLITDIRKLEDIAAAFDGAGGSGASMKTLVAVQGDET